ncbi:hypothetical protein [Cohnella sp. JJ-181]|uniref:hypothetical protein n=1 Tax=Cohnella rhizoplanae TaxID=2974897 RepID=UPI00232C555E|nr:hypothetical protein [Cohnella sp. JJ-181]
MTQPNEPSPSAAADKPEQKKISLGDAMKQRLAQKKQAASQGNGQHSGFSTDVKQMQSQIKKKPNNQKKRTGV